MNSKGKGIITAVIVVLIALAAFCGFGYISQRMTASEGITYLDKKEYQKAYEQFDHAAGKFTLIFTKQKKDVLFYEGEALYQMGEYGKACWQRCRKRQNDLYHPVWAGRCPQPGKAA